MYSTGRVYIRGIMCCRGAAVLAFFDSCWLTWSDDTSIIVWVWSALFRDNCLRWLRLCWISEMFEFLQSNVACFCTSLLSRLPPTILNFCSLWLCLSRHQSFLIISISLVKFSQNTPPTISSYRRVNCSREQNTYCTGLYFFCQLHFFYSVAIWQAVCKTESLRSIANLRSVWQKTNYENVIFSLFPL